MFKKVQLQGLVRLPLIIFTILIWTGLCHCQPVLEYQQKHSELITRVIDNVRNETLERADELLSEEPVTVTASRCNRSAGGRHCFYSEGDYWWPDPSNPSGPYIQKDGESNPGNFTGHREAMIRFSEITATLTSAWLLTGNQIYATKAIDHLHAWFVDTTTMMSPDMLYSQAVYGRYSGRGIGLIDAYHLVEIVQSVKILTENRIVPTDQAVKIKDWFRNFLTWMTTYPYGVDEMNAKNNHGTCWVATVSAMATLLADKKIVQFCSNRFKNVLLPVQMAADGSFPLELKRTKPYGYSLFNLDAMCTISWILSDSTGNLWEYITADDKSLKKGMKFIFPYIMNKSSWPFLKDIYIWDEWPVRQSCLLFAGLAYQNNDYISAFLQLPSISRHPEVVRNLPIRHPVIWLLSRP